MKKIHNIRTNYQFGSLSKSDLAYSPIKQFKDWFSQIINLMTEPTAMTLSTYSKRYGVDSRIVLLKEIKQDGFIFYTNYNSVKGKQIASNNNVSLSFFWPELQRQVRVNGLAFKLSDAYSTRYFKSRPKKSQISACISQQSEVVLSRNLMEKQFNLMCQQFKNKSIPKPDYWGGYKVKPSCIEFWQGRKDRLHDRFIYEKKDKKWVINRLYP